MTIELNASFSLFTATEKKKERSPDYSGTIEIPVDQVDALIAHLGTQPENNYRDEPVLKLRVAGWNATSKGGKEYINGKVSKPLPPMDNSATPAQAQVVDNGLPF